MKEYLSENRYHTFEFLEVDSLKAALGLVHHYDFDAVLLDLHLPDSSGLDTVRKIITALPDTAVIVLTGLQDEETAIQTVRYGAQDYLEKRNLTPVTLSKSIQYAIERKKNMQDKEDLLDDLDLALQRVEMLEDLLPLCIGCKKILDADNTWHSIQEFTGQPSTAKGSILICPLCQADLEKGK